MKIERKKGLCSASLPYGIQSCSSKLGMEGLKGGTRAARLTKKKEKKPTNHTKIKTKDSLSFWLFLQYLQDPLEVS